MPDRNTKALVQPGILLPPRQPMGEQTAIIVLNWNGEFFLERALNSIVHYTDSAYRLVLVDNGSTDNSKNYIKQFIARHPGLVEHFIDNPENQYFSRGFNQGIQATSDDFRYLVIFSNDVEVKQHGWLKDMVATMRKTGAALVGNTHRREVSEWQRNIFLRNLPAYQDPDLGRTMTAFIDQPGRLYTQVDGFCYLIDKAQFIQPGLFMEEGDFRQYHSDWELYMRLCALGLGIEQHLPAVHHWHSLSELIEHYPQRYRQLVQSLDNPATLDQYLHSGRPMFPEESGSRI